MSSVLRFEGSGRICFLCFHLGCAGVLEDTRVGMSLRLAHHTPPILQAHMRVDEVGHVSEA